MRQPLPESKGSSSPGGLSPPLKLAEVAELCESPWGLEAYSPLLEHNYLLLDLAAGERLPAGVNREAVSNRLRQLPCPVIALGEEVSPGLQRGIDVLVANAEAARTIIRNIDQHPLAAMTLVQLLRHNEDATPGQGLLAESLAYASLQGGAEFARVDPSAALPPAAAEQPERVVLVERGGEELSISLNRPHVRNAYSTAMRDEFYEALQLLKIDKSLRRAVVRGEGNCFCIGGDLHEFGSVSDPSTAHAVRSSRCVGQLLLELSSQMEFHLHRACIGAGIELPAFAARVVADNNTFIQLPEIKLGLLPGAGGTVSILQRIGRQRTAYLALSTRRLSAGTALKWGLIDAIT